MEIRRFDLNFDCENAAFAEGNERQEIERILEDVCSQVYAGKVGGPVRDINGNRIGSWGLYNSTECAV